MISCPNCGQAAGPPEWKARYHILWSNQYGQGVRVFCDACGAWSDIYERGDEREVISVHPPTLQDLQDPPKPTEDSTS